MLSRDYETNVDWIDWLTTKSLSLIWRSVFDSSVFHVSESGYDLAGFGTVTIRPHFKYSTALVDSIEDLYRPLQYEEVYQLRIVSSGVNLSFLHRSTFEPPSLRSRQKLSDVIRGRLARQRFERTNLSYLHDPQQIPLSHRVNQNLPPVLFKNGFRIHSESQDVQGVKYYHELGKFCLFLSQS